MPAIRSDVFAPERHLFAPFKGLPIRTASPHLAFGPETDSDLAITLTGAGYHLLGHLESSTEGTLFSDNDFDLMPGEHRQVRASQCGGSLVANDITVRARIPAHET